jgi:murein DD-endopeptidase MepM/ murein hydrolase activator NlpD
LVNNGIDITTASGSLAKAVFEGTVSAVLNIPGQQKALLISHGDYFTVYSRLITVDVKKGDKISLNQKLGTVWTDQEGKTVLQFQVWKGQVKQNPASWIAQ